MIWRILENRATAQGEDNGNRVEYDSSGVCDIVCLTFKMSGRELASTAAMTTPDYIKTRWNSM